MEIFNLFGGGCISDEYGYIGVASRSPNMVILTNGATLIKNGNTIITDGYVPPVLMNMSLFDDNKFSKPKENTQNKKDTDWGEIW